MTITIRDNHDGTFLIERDGSAWSIHPDPDWGIKISCIGASLIPLNCDLLHRPDVLLKQRKHVGIEEEESKPIPLLLNCPECGKRHIDVGKFETFNHHTHSCQHCGMTWRPAVVATVGVQFLPGFKNP